MQSPKQKPWLFPAGVSGNPGGKESRAARRARIEALVTEWCKPFGDDPHAVLTPAEYQLATIAAELTLRRPKRHDDQIRQGTLISRLMAQAGATGTFAASRVRRRRTGPRPSILRHGCGRRHRDAPANLAAQ
jgi:hypothetical protein